MRAARISGYGGPEVLSLTEIEAPVPGRGEVLVEVAASSVNPVDVAVRSGWMAPYLPAGPPLTLGVDIAGTVAAVGDGVDGLSVGDRVYGAAGVPMAGSGAFAEWAVAPAGVLAAEPQRTGLVAAGTLPLAGVSAVQAITETLGVEAGTRLLVHGAAGGVGLLAVELARHLGAEVTATAHRTGVGVLADLGVEVVDTDRDDVASLKPFDATLDLVGSDPELPVLVTGRGGRATSLVAGLSPELAAERGVEVSMQATGVTSERLQRLAAYVEQEVLTPRVVASFALDDISEAFERKAAGGVHGKLGVTIR